jgi:hypothetical protein
MAETRTLKNGAVMQLQPNGQWRFIKGASKDYLDSIRGKPRVSKPRALKPCKPGYERNPVTKRCRKLK